MRAMLLAAGRGERLRPLTDGLPKALVPVAGKPLIAWHLERLGACGIRDIVVNVAYLGEQIVQRIGDGARYGVRITYSREPEPLETAGGIAFARPLLADEPFLLANADVYCEFDFSRLLDRPLHGAFAHLVLVPNPPHRPEGDFFFDGSRVLGTGGAPGRRYTYAGVAVMSPALCAAVRRGEKSALAPLLYQAADRGLLTGELYEGLWQDVGTPERLAALESLLASRINETR